MSSNNSANRNTLEKRQPTAGAEQGSGTPARKHGLTHVLLRVLSSSIVLVAILAAFSASSVAQQRSHDDHQLRMQRRIEHQQRFLREHSDPLPLGGG